MPELQNEALKQSKKPKPEPKHHEEKDHLRAFGHLGRVQTLLGAAGKPQKDVTTLVDLAEKELHAGHAKGAADLLRAAEHFCFAALGESDEAEEKVAPPVRDAAEKEIEHLLEKADEHWAKEDEAAREPEVARLFRHALDRAKEGAEEQQYRQALEWARGAEALAHVKPPKPHGKAETKDQKHA